MPNLGSDVYGGPKTKLAQKEPNQPKMPKDKKEAQPVQKAPRIEHLQKLEQFQTNLDRLNSTPEDQLTSDNLIIVWIINHIELYPEFEHVIKFFSQTEYTSVPSYADANDLTRTTLYNAIADFLAFFTPNEDVASIKRNKKLRRRIYFEKLAEELNMEIKVIGLMDEKLWKEWEVLMMLKKGELIAVKKGNKIYLYPPKELRRISLNNSEIINPDGDIIENILRSAYSKIDFDEKFTFLCIVFGLKGEFKLGKEIAAEEGITPSAIDDRKSKILKAIGIYDYFSSLEG